MYPYGSPYVAYSPVLFSRCCNPANQQMCCKRDNPGIAARLLEHQTPNNYNDHADLT